MKPLYLYEVEYKNLLKRDGTLEPEDHEKYQKGDEETMKKRPVLNPARDYRRALLKQVIAARKAGKTYAYGREGGVAGRDREQVASRIAKRLGVKMHAFNLEHPDTDVENDNSRTMRYLRKKYGDDGAEAARHSMLAGQGDRRYRTKRGNRFLQRLGINTRSKKSMYRGSFPEDFKGEKQGPMGVAQLAINRLRRAGVKRRIRAMQKQGYHVGGVFGRGHFE
jgi:hypothetical protein